MSEATQPPADSHHDPGSFVDKIARTAWLDRASQLLIPAASAFAAVGLDRAFDAAWIKAIAGIGIAALLWTTWWYVRRRADRVRQDLGTLYQIICLPHGAVAQGGAAAEALRPSFIAMKTVSTSIDQSTPQCVAAAAAQLAQNLKMAIRSDDESTGTSLLLDIAWPIAVRLAWALDDIFKLEQVRPWVVWSRNTRRGGEQTRGVMPLDVYSIGSLIGTASGPDAHDPLLEKEGDLDGCLAVNLTGASLNLPNVSTRWLRSSVVPQTPEQFAALSVEIAVEVEKILAAAAGKEVSFYAAMENTVSFGVGLALRARGLASKDFARVVFQLWDPKAGFVEIRFAP